MAEILNRPAASVRDKAWRWGIKASQEYISRICREKQAKGQGNA